MFALEFRVWLCFDVVWLWGGLGFGIGFSFGFGLCISSRGFAISVGNGFGKSRGVKSIGDVRSLGFGIALGFMLFVSLLPRRWVLPFWVLRLLATTFSFTTGILTESETLITQCLGAFRPVGRF